MNAAQVVIIAGLRCYRSLISPVLSAVFTPLGHGCRFQPTCSRYALDAVRQHGAWRGSILTVKRVCRCHPWGGFGWDPVPGDKAS